MPQSYLTMRDAGRSGTQDKDPRLFLMPILDPGDIATHV